LLAQIQVVPSRWNLIQKLVGVDESDLADGGSDRLVDAMVAAGDIDTIAERVRRQFDADADHVCISITGDAPAPVLGLEQLRELAPALL
jgi:hypothetical protein